MLKNIGGVTGVVLIAVVAVLVVVGVMTGDWVLPAVLVLALAAVAVGQVASRAAAARRRAELATSGGGLWRGQVYEGARELLGRGRKLTGWTYDAVPADLTTDPSGLVLRARPATRLYGGFGERALPWTEVVGATSEELGRARPDGKLSMTRLTQVRLLLVGDLVPWFLRPGWEDAAVRELGGGHALTEQERAEVLVVAADVRAYHLHGGATDGAFTISFLTDDAEGLLETVARWARGRGPASHRP